MAKSFKLDGKRYTLPAEVPTGGIRWLVGRFHVGTPDKDLRDCILARSVAWPSERVRQRAADYAVFVHRENQALYRRATGGI